MHTVRRYWPSGPSSFMTSWGTASRRLPGCPFWWSTTTLAHRDPQERHHGSGRRSDVHRGAIPGHARPFRRGLFSCRAVFCLACDGPNERSSMSCNLRKGWHMRADNRDHHDDQSHRPSNATARNSAVSRRRIGLLSNMPLN
jgi:hypothetical protein